MKLHERFSVDLYGLVNNAGVYVGGEFDWLTIDQCEKQVAVNYLGTIRVTKHFLHHLIKSKGRIINVGSVNSLFSYPHQAVYAGTKFALKGFSESLKIEMAKFGVKVILFMPGDFAKLTEIASNQKDYFRQMWTSMNAIKQRFYAAYFNEYCDYAEKYTGYTSPLELESSTFYQDIDYIILDEMPIDIFSGTQKFKIFFNLFRTIPDQLRQKLIGFLFRAAQLDGSKHFYRHNH